MKEWPETTSAAHTSPDTEAWLWISDDGHAAKWPRRRVATFADGARESQDPEGSRPDAILTL